MYKAVVFLALAAVASAGRSIIPTKPERRVADADFIKRQKQILDLYVGIGHNKHFVNENSNWDINANLGNFVDEKYPREFWSSFSGGNFLPYDGIFSMACHHTAHNAMRLFDVFYFAKDYDTFYKAASWARNHVNPSLFAYAFSLALLHRPDTQSFVIPPLYEVFPNYFVPSDTLHQVYDYKMTGHKEGRFNYNNSGYEYNYHSGMFGGLMSQDNKGYGDFRIAYFREDVGLNSWFANWMGRNPSWMCPEKYGNVRFQRRGENFYYVLQQIFARYNLERIANGLPYAEILNWEQPIKVGYNPRISYMNGQSLYPRPDNMVPVEYNPRRVYKTEAYERRIWDAVDARLVMEVENGSKIRLDENNGIEIIGRIVYGTTDRPSRNFYRSSYYAGLDSLAYLISTGVDRAYVGNALSTPMTALRDPAFYNFVARILLPFVHFKKSLGPYNSDALTFKGVTIQSVEVDKFLTYFDMYDYEVTNGVPMHEPKEYIDHRYIARQYRLNHKPFRYNMSVNSEVEGEGIVRVFIGPKHDSNERLLTYDQARMAYFEIDRFLVHLSPGVHTWERSSSESPVFVNDQDGFRSLYSSLNNAETQKEQFYVYEAAQCGMPSRFQLPMGWHGGKDYVLAVVVSQYDRSQAGDKRFTDVACGGSRLYDGRPMGYPFDRPIRNEVMANVRNIFFRDVVIHHRDAADVNRPSA